MAAIFSGSEFPGWKTAGREWEIRGPGRFRGQNGRLRVLWFIWAFYGLNVWKVWDRWLGKPSCEALTWEGRRVRGRGRERKSNG